MTIKQAAMWLCQPGIVSMIHDPTTKKALSVAVKALAEPELSTNLAEVGTDVPDNNVGELISRQQAIETFKDCAVNGVGIDGIVDALKQLPPIQPEPKRGKWIRTGSGSLYDHYECSECGKAPKWECMGDNRWKIAFTDFCPNCGADMRGGQDG